MLQIDLIFTFHSTWLLLLLFYNILLRGTFDIPGEGE